MVTNRETAKVLYEIAVYLDMDNVPFKPRAYEKAAQTIESFDKELTEVYKEGGIKALEEIPGVGKSIAEKIEELLTTGRVATHAKLAKKMPVDVSGLTAVEGIGPKHVKVLWEKLRVKNLAELEKAAHDGKIKKLAHFGAKSEENILRAVESFKKHSGRFSIFEALSIARSIEERLKNLKEVERIVVAGSLRRWKETIGDIDILAISENPKPVMDAFVRMPEVAQVLAHGSTKSVVRLAGGLDADLRVVEARSFGAALNYFSGSKTHNVALRQIAIKKRLKLNEYGLFRSTRQIAGRTEEDLYKALGLAYIPPELREDNGEIDAAAKNKLPKLIEPGDIRGDLQVHTTWSDGKHTLEEMAKAAKKRGLAYIAITDHTKSLAMTHGSDEKKLLKQIVEIDTLNKKLRGITILKSAEVDILKDGSLDLPDRALAKLDVVGVSVHSHFKLSKEEQTKRIIRAMQNPHVDILLHPTGRIVGSREPYEVDIDEIIKTAKRTGTVLEANASYRLDLKDEYIRKAVDAGVKLVISTDAHSTAHFAWLEYGVAQARRGWATKKDVVNTIPLDELLTFFKKKKTSRF